MNPEIQDILILELLLSSGEGFFIFLDRERWVEGSLPLDRFLGVGGRSLIWWPWTRRSCSRCEISSKRKKRNLMPQSSSPRISLKKKQTQRTGHKQKKQEKGHDDDPMFVFALPRWCAPSSRSYIPEKEKDYFEKRIVGLTDGLRGKYEI